MRLIFLSLTLTFSALIYGFSPAGERSFSTLVGVSNLGADISWVRSYNKKIKYLFGLNYLEVFDEKQNYGGNSYTYDAKVAMAKIVFQYYPFNNNLRTNVGFFYNDSQASGSTTQSATTIIGTNSYNGKINLDLDFYNTAPYVGIGYGNPDKFKHWFLSADIGVIYMRRPRINLHSELVGGGSASAGDMQAEINQIRQEVDKNFKPFQAYGAIYLSYKF